LWETDGTPLGTHEVTGINGAFTSGVGPQDLTLLPAVFALLNVANKIGRASCRERVSVTVAAESITINGADTTGVLNVNDREITNVNNEVFFNGINGRSPPPISLWETDGTPLGTHEVTGINGAFTSGVGPQDLTLLPAVFALLNVAN